ncbi:MAG: tRNA (N6-isopentenyl adenosine(37)-C2)-methylthiotransferase MiaB [Bacteroidales bacterium]
MNDNKTYYIETFGCQMNIADSEVVAAILEKSGYTASENMESAGLVLMNTCAVRENAEQRIWNKLEHFRGLRKKHKHMKLGILGCMAQHVGEQFREHGSVDLVAGPDSYRQLPRLLEDISKQEFVSDLELSRTETYENILPHRLDNSPVNGFVSITRGCNNFCSYCIVPYTRGRERSRKPSDILNEVKDLYANNYHEVTLLGQNVNSYAWEDGGNALDFPDLLKLVADEFPTLRIRFTTSHPKDISDKLIENMARGDNICRHIHLPVQSGSNKILKAMNRKYTREWYLDRVKKIKAVMPDCGISTDIFAGFPGETEEDHQQSLDIMREVAYDSSFMFKYSERPGTYAAANLNDDVPEDVKTRRLNELIELQGKLSMKSNEEEVGKSYEIMIEGKSRRSDKEVFGRTCRNKLVIIPDNDFSPGDKVKVIINSCTSATLLGKQLSYGKQN